MGTRRPARRWERCVGDADAVDRYVLRAVVLPLRDFDLTFQVRKTASLRGGQVWGVVMDLDI